MCIYIKVMMSFSLTFDNVKVRKKKQLKKKQFTQIRKTSALDTERLLSIISRVEPSSSFFGENDETVERQDCQRVKSSPSIQSSVPYYFCVLFSLLHLFNCWFLYFPNICHLLCFFGSGELLHFYFTEWKLQKMRLGYFTGCLTFELFNQSFTV